MDRKIKDEEFEQFKELYIKYCKSRNCEYWHCYNCRIADTFKLIFYFHEGIYEEKSLPWQVEPEKKETRCSMCRACKNT